MRGKPDAARRQIPQRRIIPARAGQTRRPRPWPSTPPDHPRACGANITGGDGIDGHIGSSPRVRGKLVLLALPSRPIRIIPARAGQTWRRASSTPCPTDHPRACGANNWRSTGKGPSYGASPRVRGKLTGSVKEDFSMNGRIIPARAGQTQAHRLRPYLHPDHPRACGANEAQDGSDDLVPGSSPRVRGKRARPATAHERRRIIPARAGQTTASI